MVTVDRPLSNGNCMVTTVITSLTKNVTLMTPRQRVKFSELNLPQSVVKWRITSSKMGKSCKR